jgi:hypothetical protein
VRTIGALLSVLVVWTACSLRSTDDLQKPAAATTSTGPGGGGAAVGGAGGSAGCAAPMADCDNDDTCETNLADDRAHCGACNYRCDGIACEAGSCLLDRLDDNMPAWQIAIDDTHAYLTSDRVVILPLDGSEDWENFHIGSPMPFGIHIDDTHVWWVGQQIVGAGMVNAAVWRRMRGPGSPPEELVWSDNDPQMQKSAGAITGSNLAVAWSFGNAAPTEVRGAVKTQLSTVFDVASGEPGGAWGMATNAQLELLWVNDGGDLGFWSPNQPSLDVTTGLARPFDVVLSGDEAYYVSLGAADMRPNGSLERIRWSPPAAPGEPETLLADLAEPLGLVLDNTHVYLSESSFQSDTVGSIKRVDRSTFEVETLARAKSPDDIVGDIDMRGGTIAWFVIVAGAPVEIWKRSNAAYALP